MEEQSAAENIGKEVSTEVVVVAPWGSPEWKTA